LQALFGIRHLAAALPDWEVLRQNSGSVVEGSIEKIVQGSGAINLLARELLGAGRGLPPEVKLTAPL
jgi:hypothetical protein